MNIVEMNNVSKSFGRVQALDQVTLRVKKGEIFGFIGPNGAGKSTAIRVLLGIIRASSGTASIFEKDVWKEAVAVHHQTAYVPGDVHLWPNLSGGEVIDFMLRLNGGGNKQKKEELIERFQLDPKKKCRTYSKGNRQKVALVAAFASDASLFILDEPTSGLDPLMERTFQECVFEAKREGKTILLSSHILSEVEKLCDRLAIIRNGSIIETGSLQELRHLTRVEMRIGLHGEAPDFHALSAVAHAEKVDDLWLVQVEADQVNQVVDALHGRDVYLLESAPPTLEDLFMRYYEKEEQP
ncbi:ABC transporter ATP-binding protein [Alkalicoccus urumqiensis]|uniref:ABC transporter ATP-binding protein n=1 Tax=Alkalicoccus urumqiensis TaxID=1548213 RepID=A0A2P6MJC2_ALKUR|nr:ABC transporter ATP-binding protein [Alkalicoccus urumqiensis]PRO66371.1 ABC transporter ATP-binding protein [Alkalicoccus urumqiensis]